MALLLAVMATAWVVGCTPRPPRNVDDCCQIFKERRGWYRAAARSSQRWGVPIHIQLAIVHQESRFDGDARPPRRRILWIFPGPRRSDAHGYAQALKSTWREYKAASGNGGADRDDFGDAVDFIGWYAARSSRELGIRPDDAYNLYLAYHEGNGGFRRQTYRRKPWLVGVAGKVERRSDRYRRQLVLCEDELKPRWWQFWL